MQKVLIAGEWSYASASGSFKATNPATGEEIDREFPTSDWSDCDRALTAAVQASDELRQADPEKIASFLEAYAARIEVRAAEIVALANAETGLPIKPRLADVELPRTTTQLRQGAAAAREGSWTQAVIDSKNNIRSHFAPIGPVVVFGPNNFPFAFNGVSGGDFAAAIASGNPVIAKAHPLHPATSQALAECAMEALASAGLPPATVQMLFNIGNEDGLRLVADPRVGASSFTGSRFAGMKLKAAAEAVGKPIYLEMSSLNPIILLPGALAERGSKLPVEVADSGLAAAGQFCTSPNLILMVDGPEAQAFAQTLTALYAERTPGVLLSKGGLDHLGSGVEQLRKAGAEVLTGACPATDRTGFVYTNTVLKVDASDFLTNGPALQKEAFGNVTMLILTRDADELMAALASLEGNLTGSIYSSTDGKDDALYAASAAILREKVGRLMNDKMPTGVALSPAMNHGGPFPSTSHPGFTAVGIPRSMLRFGALHCYDNVRPHRLPAVLQDKAPHDKIWRCIDGAWIKG